MPYAAVGLPQGDSSNPATGKCPPPTDCYKDIIMPNCPPGTMCTPIAKEVIACKWTCGNKSLPTGCEERCKPCRAEVCTAVCECEITCSVDGPCTAVETASSA
ncbi:hypothetical protein H4S02_002414 [Coemansia sp. RSA 2611]|nr:hypothetical protein H4S02_002414 [Coemansia sp. RSA 2611]